MARRKHLKLSIDTLVDEHQEELYWYLRKLLICHETTKDVLQEVYIRAWKYLPKFRGDADVSTWLYRIAHNEAIRYFDKAKRRLEATELQVEDELLDKLEASILISSDHLELQLQKAILTLPLVQREVFTMRYFDDMKYDKIANILETSVGSAKVSYHHAKKKIEEYIKA